MSHPLDCRGYPELCDEHHPRNPVVEGFIHFASMAVWSAAAVWSARNLINLRRAEPDWSALSIAIFGVDLTEREEP